MLAVDAEEGSKPLALLLLLYYYHYIIIIIIICYYYYKPLARQVDTVVPCWQDTTIAAACSS